MRKSGILLHISSLPGPDGIGSLGKEAFEFADFLSAAGMTIWQVLPMGPTGYGESPYQSTCVYAGNPLLISLEKLAEAGLFHRPEGFESPASRPDQVDFAAVRDFKMKLLREAFSQCESKMRQEMADFIRKNPWAEDFALFTAVKEHFGGKMWTKWPDREIKMRRSGALKKYRALLEKEIRFHLWCQCVFFSQWQALKAYCNQKGISLFGDMPIYVAEDSADTWTAPQIFQLDKNRVPRRVAGVPPDYFSADGQLWGNPLFRWHFLYFRRYDWWVRRMAHMAKMYDIIRIDHFIGFANYYSIAHGAPNAREGKWIIGPGKKFFRRLKKALPGLNVVAEDLGAVNDRVRDLLAFTEYPGMKVLTFAFGGGDDNMHLPQNIPENTAYYTGTHDNQTALAWAQNASPEELRFAEQKIGFHGAQEAPWALVKAILESRARIAVAQMQDVLGLGEEATMNHPGTVGGNWLWRMLPGAASGELAEKLRILNQQSNRGNAL